MNPFFCHVPNLSLPTHAPPKKSIFLAVLPWSASKRSEINEAPEADADLPLVFEF